MLLLQRQKLVNRIEALELDSRTCIKHILIRPCVEAVSSAITIGDCITDYIPILIKENEVNTPCVDGYIICLPGFLKPFDYPLIKPFKIPYKSSVLFLLGTIRETMDCLHHDSAVRCKTPFNELTAGSSDIDCKIYHVLYFTVLFCNSNSIFP